MESLSIAITMTKLITGQDKFKKNDSNADTMAVFTQTMAFDGQIMASRVQTTASVPEKMAGRVQTIAAQDRTIHGDV